MKLRVTGYEFRVAESLRSNKKNRLKVIGERYKV